MKFIERVISQLLKENEDLSQFSIVLPGKRPVVFIRRILEEKQYSGFLPDFFTVDDLITKISGKQPVKGVSLWLFAFEIYRELQPNEDFSEFLKWFPTVVKDWDDMLKFTPSDKAVLEYMFDEERIKNWAEQLGDNQDNARKRFLNFWQKMNIFLPLLKSKLNEKNWATPGMIHESASHHIDNFVKNSTTQFVFCGFNALTSVEEQLIRTLLQWDKAQCFFQTDHYYLDDPKQEAGKFLREIRQWKEFNDHRPFHWIEDDFAQPKNIKVYEVPGNITQTKVLPEILQEMGTAHQHQTAVVLLDENLLPASIDALSSVDHLNITMGFPLKNLAFSNAMKKLFYLQKQLEKKEPSYYYNDVLAIVEELPNDEHDTLLIQNFKQKIEARNIVYLSKKQLAELLSPLSYYALLLPPESASAFLHQLVDYCRQLKYRELDDVLYENISHFEKSFTIIQNQISPYQFPLKMETLEVLINQLVGSETIDFEGEPLMGLQVMGLLETRLLNFENIILLSANEGKLPLGNSQNTYLPFDVRRHFGMHTFLENDSIYSYHFYRLLQDSKNIYLLFNALDSGINTGEQSRFITQLEIEDHHHNIEKIVIDSSSDPIQQQLMTIPKTASVLEKLELWKERVSASHLTSYIYDPISFYLNKILGTREGNEIEEELSQRSYGQLVHLALQRIYEKLVGKPLQVKDLHYSTEAVNEVINEAILELHFQPEFYERGMNFIHKSIAQRVVHQMLEYDKKLLERGNTLEILDVEGNFEGIPFLLNEETGEKVNFYGFIDRIDRLNGTLRIIDYKTARTKNLSISTPKKEEDIEKTENLFFRDDYKQAMQLCIYAYSVLVQKRFPNQNLQCGILSFAEVNKGVQQLSVFGENNINLELLQIPMKSVGNVIKEILDPSIPFEEKIHQHWDA
ncbi:MAG: PD-(D/E)XK nuclease family protein [Chryseobacterium sp.]|nr:PD-(D/E)XK nuclease family protein [Chryseobacterium sp.]